MLSVVHGLPQNAGIEAARIPDIGGNDFDSDLRVESGLGFGTSLHEEVLIV